RTYSDTSHSLAPSRRMRTISVTRNSDCALLAFGFFFSFMAAHRFQNPAGMPLRQAGIVDEAELLPAATISAEIRTPFYRKKLAGREGQGDNFRVRMAARRALLALAELSERFLPQISVVTPKKDRCQECQAGDLPTVQPS